jgi:hypothetical protein
MTFHGDQQNIGVSASGEGGLISVRATSINALRGFPTAPRGLCSSTRRGFFSRGRAPRNLGSDMLNAMARGVFWFLVSFLRFPFFRDLLFFDKMISFYFAFPTGAE